MQGSVHELMQIMTSVHVLALLSLSPLPIGRRFILEANEKLAR